MFHQPIFIITSEAIPAFQFFKPWAELSPWRLNLIIPEISVNPQRKMYTGGHLYTPELSFFPMETTQRPPGRKIEPLGHTHYIVWSKSSDMGVLYVVGGKKIKIKIWILILVGGKNKEKV